MPDSDLLEALLHARAALDARWAEAWEKVLSIQTDLDQIGEMLIRNGYVESSSLATTADEPALPGTIEMPTPISGDLEKRLSVDQIVEKVLRESGPAVTAQSFCEHLFESGVVRNPCPVRDLFDSFPPPLRGLYSANRTSAVEALRLQIKNWIARGETSLTYQNGLVGVPNASSISDIDADEERTA
jgi:hypothetical protein